MIDNDGFDVVCIWFTDEEHFHFNEFVSKQKNPYLCEANPLHYHKITVWTVVCSRSIFGPFFIRE